MKVHVLARPPHKLKKQKLVEAVGGMRIMDDVGIKVHKLKGSSYMPSCCLLMESEQSLAPSTWRLEASTAAVS